MYTSPNGHRCLIVALEGPDRIGKSTQAQRIAHALKERKIRGAVEKAPFKDGVTYDRIYEMLRTGEAVEHPVVFQSFMGINRRLFQTQYLPDLAQEMDVVVLDRWNVSTLVYGSEGGVSAATTWCILKGILEPDLVFLFTGEPFASPDTDDAYEADKDYQRRIQDTYKAWGKSNPARTHWIKANEAPERITDEIVGTIQYLMRVHLGA